MRSTRTGALAALLASAALLGGCWDDGDVTVHSQGEYKGPQDPLAAESSASREEELAKRFDLVQRDR